MTDLREKITEIAKSKLTDDSQFIVDVVASSNPGSRKVVVILDGDTGVTIDDVTNLSRAISAELDEQPLMEDNYTLEVGTPGLDQPLKMKRQYYKNIGRELKVHTTDKKIIQGLLTEVSEERIVLDVKEGKKKETKPAEIPFSHVEKAIVMVSFK
jgi:ribosome maturation factor RimP